MRLFFPSSLWAIALFALPATAAAQQFKASTNYARVSVGDTFAVRFIYTGETDGLKDFEAPDFKPFVLAGGPFQSNSTSSKRVGDTMVITKKVTLSYNLYSGKPGRFVIPAAAISDREGKVYHTMPLSMEVSVTPVPRDAAGQPPFLDEEPFFNPFGDKWFEESQVSYTTNEAIHRSGAPYVLITGWVYLPDSVTQGRSDRIMTEVDRYMATRTDARLIGKIGFREAARRYYTIKDTNGLAAALFPIYRTGGRAAKAKVILTHPAAWSVAAERHAFDDDRYAWTLIHDLLQQAVGSGAAPGTKCRLLLSFAFRDLSKMDRFTSFAQKHGYAVAESKREKALKEDQYYIVLSVLSTIEEKALYKAVSILSDEAVSASCEGQLTGLATKKEP